MNFLIRQVWGATLFVAVEFMIALPYRAAVFVGGVPDLRAVPATALTAFYLAGEKVNAAVVAAVLPTPRQLALYHIENLRLDNSLMVILDVILRNLALVELFLFREEIDGVALLKQRIAAIQQWLKDVYKWPSVATYMFAILKETGKTLSEIRETYMATHDDF